MPVYTYTTLDDPSATGSTFATGINAILALRGDAFEAELAGMGE